MFDLHRKGLRIGFGRLHVPFRDFMTLGCCFGDVLQLQNWSLGEDPGPGNHCNPMILPSDSHDIAMRFPSDCPMDTSSHFASPGQRVTISTGLGGRCSLHPHGEQSRAVSLCGAPWGPGTLGPWDPGTLGPWVGSHNEQVMFGL